jgi:splicing factor 3A subunit 1
VVCLTFTGALKLKDRALWAERAFPEQSLAGASLPFLDEKSRADSESRSAPPSHPHETSKAAKNFRLFPSRLATMAPSAVDQNAAQAALDEAVSKPPTGVVLPPKDIRAIVERTAGYVARNGPVFEDRIRQKELNNPKFSFIASHDAYNPFYVWRLEEIRAGRGTVVAAGRVGEEPAHREPEKPKGPEPPPDFYFSARMPNISASDLDVVKLTALFVAKNGRNFATNLAQRESTKSQFDFLRPQHSLHQFYTRLVDQYTELLNGSLVDGGKPERQKIAELEKNIKDKFTVLERAKKRAEWVKFQESEKTKKEEEAEAERLSYAQIDWHDFVVVETILFNEQDEQTDLPPPTSLSDLQSASLEQKANMSLAPHNMRIEEAMPTDEMYAMQPPAIPYPPQTAPSIPAPPPNLPMMPVQAQYDAIPEPTGVAPPRIRQGENAPRTMARRRNVATAMCPNCRQQIPMDELEQHMKGKFHARFLFHTH